ncbi:MAG: TonB-dependent receptor [Pseudomonadota bacterium]
MFAKKPLAGAIGALSAASALTAVVAAPQVAHAESADTIEEVVVTGSRIKKKDFVSNAPVATVDAEQFTLTNTVNTENLLNSLPQTVAGLDRTSNNPGNGTATVDLRGLGSNRTLVLINGKRVVPTSRNGTVDINTIPTALIEQVEVLTGGASAVYGSDALAGVVNFVLKDDFEGVAVDAGYEITEDGDAGLFSTNLTVGGNFADGRGNAVVSFNYTDRDDLFQGDRGFSTFAQFDDGDGGFINGGSSGIPGTSIFAGGFGSFSDTSGVTFDPDGSVRPFRVGDDNDFYNYAPVNYIQLPQKRYQISGLAHYDLNENVTVYGSAFFTSSDVPQQLAPTPIFQNTTFTLDGSPFLTADAQQVISDAIGDGVDTDGDGIDDTASALVRRRLLEVGPRRSVDGYDTWQVQGGVRGGNETWDYDLYVQRGQVNNSGGQQGNVNRDRFNQALLLDLSDPTGGTCQDSSANGATVNCSPINIFGEGNISEAGAAYLRTAVSSTAIFEQSVASVNISSSDGLYELPGGPIGVSFGYEYIENSFEFLPSQDLAAGTIAGFNGAPGVAGDFDVHSVNAELYLPLLSDRPGIELLDLELAVRYSDYSTSGDVTAFKVAGSWAITPDLRFRAGFNRAIRAPGIGELFSPQGEGFPGAQDPCSAAGTDAESRTAELSAICAATGVPADVIFTNVIDAPAGQVRQLSGGNPNLDPEEADTFTVGAVITPAAVQGLSVAVDYFDIDVQDYISVFGGGANNVLRNCYDTDADSVGGAGSAFCNVVNRRADGTIDFVEVTQQNVARQTLKGIDVVASYDFDFRGGLVGIDYVGTYTTESEFTAFEGDTPIACDGRFGQLVCGDPLAQYSHRATVNWSNDTITTQLTWRFVGEVDDDDPDTDYSVETIGDRSYVDLTAGYNFGGGWTATFGVDNVFDKNPPIIGDNQEQANTYPATYDVFGRTYFLRIGTRMQ